MRVIVCGSRRWTDRSKIENRFFDLVRDFDGPSYEITIIHGAAKGTDRIAGQEALKAGMLVEEHPAEWERYGKRAGIIRNVEMADLGADLCIAFWDGQSTGTKHMAETALKDGIPVEWIR